MAIPAILRGDTPQPISVTVPDALASLTVSFQDVVRQWTNVTAGATVQLQFTKDETSRFVLGTSALSFVGVNAAGAMKTYPITAKVKVTDCPGEVYNAVVDISGGSGNFDLKDVRINMDDQQNNINAVIAAIVRKGGGTVIGAATMALAIMFGVCLDACGITVSTAKFGQMTRTNDVVVAVGAETDPTVDAKVAAATNALAGAFATKGEVVAATNGITAASIGAVAQTLDDTEHKTFVKIGDDNHDGYVEVKGGSLSVGITSIKTDGIDVGTDTSGEINIGHYQGVINLGDGDGKVVINGGFGEGDAYITIGGSNAATLADATNIVDSAIAAAPTTYTNVTGSAYVALNQSVQTITVNGTAITIGAMPTPVPGGTRDFVIYVNNTSATTDAPLSLPSGTYYGDEGATNAFPKGTVSALYLTEMSGGAFVIGRRELTQIVIQ